MSLYDDMQSVAQSLFAEFGQGVVNYIKVTPGNGPVDDPGASTETSFTLVGATARGVQFKYVQLSLAVATDVQVSMPVDSRFTPDPKDFISIDGVRHKIVQIIRKPEAGTPVAYTILVRK